MKRILIIDDDTYMRKLLVNYLEKNNYEAKGAENGKSGVKNILKENFDLLICDFRLPDMDGLEVLKRVKKINPALNIIIITAYADISMAVKLMKLGAYDYVTKPLQHEEILALVKKALHEKNENKEGTKSKNVFSNNFIKGKSLKIKEVLNHIDAVAPTDIPVLIQGETGSGKEFIARAIHNTGKRKNKAFIPVDCGALPGELANSEMFGHVKGAFTGAIVDKKGYFEAANGGTLFLDEIGNLPYENQVKLLRALQENVINRLGENKNIKIDVRLLTATNDELYGQVENNNFREDLYHRINGFKIQLPPLRERKEDIMEFAHEFLKNANEQFNKSIQGFDEEVKKIFFNYSWPGNIRELKNIVNRCVLLSVTDIISSDYLPPEIKHASKTDKQDIFSNINSIDNNGFNLKDIREGTEKEMIINALKETSNNKSKAARMLNIDRKTLYNKLKEYNIDPDEI